MSYCHIVTLCACHIITLCALYKHHHSHDDKALTISLDDGNDDGDKNSDNNDERSLLTLLMTLMMMMTVTEMTIVTVHLKKALQPSQT